MDWLKAALQLANGDVPVLHKITWKASQDVETFQRLTLLSSKWMKELLPIIGDRTLDTICLPNSHDAGIYKINNLIRLGSESTTRTQTKDILGQLSNGVRIFDIRPVIRGGKVYCGHYTYIKSIPPAVTQTLAEISKIFPQVAINAAQILEHYSGADGATLQEVIDQVNLFTSGSNEVVILNLSHAFNFDREEGGNEWSCQFNQSEWDTVLEQVSHLKNLYTSNEGINAQLKNVKIKDLIGNGQSAVIVTVDHSNETSITSTLAGKGFYESKQWEGFGGRSVTHMQDDTEAVFGYLSDHVPAMFVNAFASQWGQSAFTKQHLYSITDIARKVKSEQLPKVIDEVAPGDKCQSIIMDDLHDDDCCAMAVRVIGKMIHGKDMELKWQDGQWTFV